MADAVEDGLLVGPRLFVSGLALTQTGGHADFRPRTATSNVITCACQASTEQLGRIADGIDECRRAARTSYARARTRSRSWPGAGWRRRPIPIWNTQYSAGEIRAICEEAEAWRTYVLAHAYIPKAIIRAVENGVRTIEHGNLLDAEAAKVMAEHGAYLVPTSVTYRALRDHGREFGFPEVSMRKLGDVLEVGMRAIETARDAGVRIGHGSDLLGECQVYQSDEFAIKAESPRKPRGDPPGDGGERGDPRTWRASSGSSGRGRSPISSSSTAIPSRTSASSPARARTCRPS